MTSTTRVFLTGFMGSGKSSIGDILANVLGFDFFDLDKVIEKNEGEKIKSIFNRLGESAFREMESKELRYLSQRENIVVALGGGSLIPKSNMDLVQNNGLLVYLKLEPEALADRLMHSRKRPLILDKDGVVLEYEKLLKRIRGMLHERQSMYNEAHLTVDLANEPIGKAVDKVASAVSNFGI